MGHFPADEIQKFLLYNFIETVAKVSGQGAASCFSCGYGETCKVGIPIALHGEGVKITPETIPDVTRQEAVMQAAVAAGKHVGAASAGRSRSNPGDPQDAESHDGAISEHGLTRDCGENRLAWVAEVSRFETSLNRSVYAMLV